MWRWKAGQLFGWRSSAKERQMLHRAGHAVEGKNETTAGKYHPRECCVTQQQSKEGSKQ
jgi:hypothetical protein